MDFGKLDRRITFQSFTETIGSEGSPVRTWADASTNWASFSQMMPSWRGGESIEHGAVNATVKGFFRVRYNSSFTPDRTMRIVYNSTNLEIADIRELPGRNQGWEILVRADAE